jgi:hypothetical protein
MLPSWCRERSLLRTRATCRETFPLTYENLGSSLSVVLLGTSETIGVLHNLDRRTDRINLAPVLAAPNALVCRY